MNKSEIISSVIRIRESIEYNLKTNENITLLDNFNGGIKQCDLIIKKLNSNFFKLNEKDLFSCFDRYVSDSLPWTGDILEVIQKERKIIHQNF